MQLVVAGGGGLDLLDEPEVGAGQARRCRAGWRGGGMGGVGRRGGRGGAGCAGARRADGAGAPGGVEGGEAGEAADDVGVEEAEEATGRSCGVGVRRDGGADAIGHPGEERQGWGCVWEGVELHLLEYMVVDVRWQGENVPIWAAGEFGGIR